MLTQVYPPLPGLAEIESRMQVPSQMASWFSLFAITGAGFDMRYYNKLFPRYFNGSMVNRNLREQE